MEGSRNAQRAHWDRKKRVFKKGAFFCPTFALRQGCYPAWLPNVFRVSHGQVMWPVTLQIPKTVCQIKSLLNRLSSWTNIYKKLALSISLYFFSFNCLNQSSKAKTLQFESQSAKKTCRGFHHFRWRWKLDSNLEVGLKKVGLSYKKAS